MIHVGSCVGVVFGRPWGAVWCPGRGRPLGKRGIPKTNRARFQHRRLHRETRPSEEAANSFCISILRSAFPAGPLVRLYRNRSLTPDFPNFPDEVELAHRYTQRVLEDLYDDRATVEAILTDKKDCQCRRQRHRCRRNGHGEPSPQHLIGLCGPWAISA